ARRRARGIVVRGLCPLRPPRAAPLDPPDRYGSRFRTHQERGQITSGNPSASQFAALHRGGGGGGRRIVSGWWKPTVRGMYLTAVRQLKSPSPRTLRLPSLPLLERLTERSLVVATALLMGGLATGGAAMQLSRSISLAQPSIILALMTMALLVLVLALRA